MQLNRKLFIEASLHIHAFLAKSSSESLTASVNVHHLSKSRVWPRWRGQLNIFNRATRSCEMTRRYCASEKEAVDTHTPTSNMKLCMYTKPDEQYVTKRRIRCLVHTLTSSSLPHSTNLDSSSTCQHQDLNSPLPNMGCKKLCVRCKTQLLLKLVSFLKRGRTICPSLTNSKQLF